MNIIIADDEPLARERLRRMVEQLPAYDVTGECADGASVLACVREQQPDVVLLDIHMPGYDGLQVAGQLVELPLPPAVIFTTAHVEHALSAHNLAVAGYLLKPVTHAALVDALTRARRLSRAQLQALDGAQAVADTRFVIARSQDGQVRVPVDDVIFFRADQKYTTVHHVHGELLIEEALSTLEQRFDDVFMRIHREALVARRYIMALEAGTDGQMQLKLRHCEQPLPVSRRRVAEVRRCLSSHESS